MLEPLSRAARADVIAYLAARPYENVFLQWIVEGGLGTGIAFDSVVVWRRGKIVGGVGFFGPQIVIAADNVDAIDAFAMEASERGPARMIVGPRTIINHFWGRIRSWHRPPTLVRTSQPLYVLERPPSVDDVAIRRADEGDLLAIADNSAEMMVGELGYDPRVHRTNFVQSVDRLIGRGWWWVWSEDGELRFQCNIGSKTSRTVQLQGVWTPPELRGRGYATRGLGSLCRKLLDDVPSVSLYVNDFNHDAIALYERLGFVRAGEFVTYLFNDS